MLRMQLAEVLADLTQAFYIQLNQNVFLLIRPQVSDRQRPNQELRDHLLQRRLLPDVWLHPGGDHAAALHVPVSGGTRDHEECSGPAGPGPAGL